MIITDRNQINSKQILVMTSIGGAPIHEGHVRLIRDCKTRVAEAYRKLYRKVSGYDYENPILDNIKLLVIVNCDDFLIRKHSFSFQDENARAEILDSIKDVDYTFIHQTDKQTIDDAIHYFQPHYFCKGGDRSGPQYMPEIELEACKLYGTEILYGVGGTEKASSSSDLMKRCANHYLFEERADKWIDDIERFTQGEYPSWRSR
jgi:glycerol-3-phosphate cytidylyltransferase/D-beta-D-heptose 7-phosphate kinase/D-beta-D-heptose 1-phosphate adenosyltransferase